MLSQRENNNYNNNNHNDDDDNTNNLQQSILLAKEISKELNRLKNNDGDAAISHHFNTLCNNLFQSIKKLPNKKLKDFLIKQIQVIKYFFDIVRDDDIAILPEVIYSDFLLSACDAIEKIENNLANNNLDVPIELIEIIFESALQASQTKLGRERLRQRFCAINSVGKQIADKLVYKIYADGSKERLDLEIGKFFYSPGSSSLKRKEIEFLLKHPNATLNLYVFEPNINLFDYSVQYVQAQKVFFIREDALKIGEKFIESFNQIIDNYSFSKNLHPEAFYRYGVYTASSLLRHVLLAKDNSLIDTFIESKAKFDLAKCENEFVLTEKNRNLYINNSLVRYDDDIKSTYFVQGFELIKELVMQDDSHSLAYFLKYASPETIKDCDAKYNLMKLAICYKRNSQKAIELLIKAKVNMNSISIHDGARIGSIDLIKYFLDLEVRVDVKDVNGLTPLSIATHYEQLEAIDFLIKNKADLPDSSDQSDLPDWLINAIKTWNKDVFIKFFNSFLLGKNLKATSLIILDWLLNIDYLNKNFDSEDHDRYLDKQGYQIYNHLCETLQYDTWDRINKISEVLKASRKDSIGRKFIAKCLYSIINNNAMFDVDNIIDVVGNNIYHYLLQIPMMPNDNILNKFVRLHCKPNNNLETPCHYILKKCSESKSFIERATYLENIYKISIFLNNSQISNLSADSSGNLPGDYLLNVSLKQQKCNDEVLFGVYKKFLLPTIFLYDSNGYTRLHKAVMQMNAKDLDNFFSYLRNCNIKTIPLAQNHQTLLHVAVISNKIENLSVINLHKILFKKTKSEFHLELFRADIFNKSPMNYAKDNNDMISALAKVNNTSLTHDDLAKALTSYYAIKNQFFGAKQVTQSNKTKTIIDTLKKEKNDYNRFFAANTYLKENSKKEFAKQLNQVMPKTTNST